MADILVSLGALLLANTRIKEIELNPVLLKESGAAVLDANARFLVEKEKI